MPEDLDVAEGTEVEEIYTAETEEDRRWTGGDDSNHEGRNQVASQDVHYSH